ALLDAVFEIVRVGQGGDEVQGGDDVDAGLVGMVDAQAMALGGVPADSLGAGQAAYAGHVHLHDVDAADIHHALELADVANLLARGDAHRTLSAEPGVALDVVRMQRLFQPGKIELLELLRTANRGRGVPAQTRIHHQLDVWSQPGACGPDVGNVA